MKAKILLTTLISVLVIFVVTSGFVSAQSNNPGKGKQPANAGRPEKLEQIIFVHPVAPEKPGKPDKPPGKPPKDDEPEEPKENSYYELWGGYLDGTIQYKINPNIPLVTGGNAFIAIESAAEAWDIETVAELFDYAGTTNKNWYANDNENIISWVKFFPQDYIAVAVMQYDPATMIIYEVDVVFNAFHRWGINPRKRDRAFDVQNIATHEFGHPLGLDDLYDSLYRELTMYGYSSKGEIEKCSLEEGDVKGVQELYGP